MLGEGTYQVLVSDRGGQALMGEVTDIARLAWERQRDEVSVAQVTVRSPSPSCCALLGGLRSIRHELVILRGGVRVWEGPITRIEYGVDRTVIDARDVLYFATHRALTRTFDFTGTRTPALGMLAEALRDVYGQNADDPYGLRTRVVPLLSTNDVNTAAKVPAWSRTVGDLLEGYARNGGVDYTVLGRQVLLWDVHCRVAETLPLSSQDFLSPPVVTEYGMNLATRVGVTNSEGAVSIRQAPADWVAYYGLIDEVVTSQDETEPGGQVTDVVAETLLDARYPAPVLVRVPENSALSPTAPVTIQDLVPGAHIPVQVSGTCRDVTQVQKLDRLSVTVEAGREQVQVSMATRPATVVERL